MALQDFVWVPCSFLPFCKGRPGGVEASRGCASFYLPAPLLTKEGTPFGTTHVLPSTHTIIPSSTQSRPSRAPAPRAGCATSLQPFVSYSTKTHTTFGLNTESVYDWEHSQWTVPINVTVSQLLKIGGPNWSLRFAVTFLFPK